MRKEGLFLQEDSKNSLNTPENRGQALTELSTFLGTSFLDLYGSEIASTSKGKSLFEKMVQLWINELSKRIGGVIEEDPNQLFNILAEAKKENYNYPIFNLNSPEERQEFCDSVVGEAINFHDIPENGGSPLFYLNERAEYESNKTFNVHEKGIFYSAVLEAVLALKQKELIPFLVLKLKSDLNLELKDEYGEEMEGLSFGYWEDDSGGRIFADEYDHNAEEYEARGYRFISPDDEEYDLYREKDLYKEGEEEQIMLEIQEDLKDPEFLSYLRKEFERNVSNKESSFYISRLMEGAWIAEDMNDMVLFQETLLKNIGKLEGSEENIKMVIGVLKDNFPKMFENFNGVSTFFNKNPGVSSRELLKLRQEEEHSPHKVFLTMLIYRLEFGEMNISEEGLEYLGKKLDLGEFNSGNYFAHRGTGDGKIFIFGQDDKELKSYVDFATVDNDEQEKNTLKVEMLSFTYDVLFVPKLDETAEDKEQKIKFVEEFKEKYFKVYLEDLAGKVGVNLNNFGIREQAWFLWYFESCDENRQSRVVDFLKKYGENGFGIFVLQEMDHKTGDKILEIGEKGNEGEVKKIFAEIESIIRLSELTEKEIEQMFFEDDTKGFVKKDKITQDILNRSLQVLNEYYDLVERGETGHQNLEDKLQKNKKDLILFAAVFKNAFAKGQEIDFSQIKGLDLSIMDSGELSDQDKKQMRDIFKGNRTGVSPEFAEQRLKGEFDPVMSESGHKFYMLKKDGQIISFARFDELENGNLYTGFINTAPDIKGMNIGSAFLETVFQREGQKKAIELKVREDNPAVKLYERFGFEVEGEPHEDPETKKVYLKMVRPPKAEELREAA